MAFTEGTCKICHRPTRTEWQATGSPEIDAVLERVARHNLVHEDCWRGEMVKKAIEKLHAKAAYWTTLCDPLYLTSDEWIETPAAARKLRMAAVREARGWQFGAKGLLLHGAKSGTGKTTTAWILCKREFDAGRMIVAMTHTELAQSATRLASGERQLSRWQGALKSCDLLFLDDLGKSRFKRASGEGRAAEEFLYDLLDFRVRNQRPVIITSNLSAADLREGMSEERAAGFIRRLAEYFHHVSFDAPAKESELGL